MSRARRTLLLALLLAAAPTACTAPPTADVVRVGAGRYEAAFDAAVEAARLRGLVPSIRDRRSGIIETDTRLAPSLLEPGGRDHASLEERLEHTVAMERLRARFEFIPTSLGPPSDEPGAALTGPDLLALERGPVDLTKLDEPLELRVWVFVEQSHVPGLRLTTWSRRNTTVTQIIEPDGRPEPATFWTSVGRNPRFERRLLADVARDLESRAVPAAIVVPPSAPPGE